MKHFDCEGHIILPVTYETLKTKFRWNSYILFKGKNAEEWS